MEIADFQAHIASVYGEADAERGIPATVAWL
ncbi:MAG: pyrophosphohydrolase, partial [Actinomycetia bacterium]|nr:pyrophosphohydrolase [Actinomycetes bacterium]